MSNFMSAEKAIENCELNIEMFAGYRPTEWNKTMLEGLMKTRQELINYAAGVITREQLSYQAREAMWIMPEWGYKGT